MHHEIEFKNVSFTYPDESFSLKDLSFKINLGRKFAICGRNGAGKTTLLRMLMGLEFPQTGSINIQEFELNKNTIIDARKRIGFVFQNPDSQVFSASVYEDVAFGPRNLGCDDKTVDSRVDEALKAVDLTEYRDYSPFRLSFGQRKRVAIAGVIAMNPSIVVLDEPFANLDYPSKLSIQNLLEKDIVEKGKTLIFTTHSRKLIQEWADSVLFLEKGKILYIGPVNGLGEVSETELYLGPS